MTHLWLCFISYVYAPLCCHYTILHIPFVILTFPLTVSPTPTLQLAHSCAWLLPQTMVLYSCNVVMLNLSFYISGISSPPLHCRPGLQAEPYSLGDWSQSLLFPSHSLTPQTCLQTSIYWFIIWSAQSWPISILWATCIAIRNPSVWWVGAYSTRGLISGFTSRHMLYGCAPLYLLPFSYTLSTPPY